MARKLWTTAAGHTHGTLPTCKQICAHPSRIPKHADMASSNYKASGKERSEFRKDSWGEMVCAQSRKQLKVKEHGNESFDSCNFQLPQNFHSPLASSRITVICLACERIRGNNAPIERGDRVFALPHRGCNCKGGNTDRPGELCPYELCIGIGVLRGDVWRQTNERDASGLPYRSAATASWSRIVPATVATRWIELSSGRLVDETAKGRGGHSCGTPSFFVSGN